MSIGNLGFARKPGVSENIQNDIYPYLIDSNVSFTKLSLFMLQVLRKPEVVQSLHNDFTSVRKRGEGWLAGAIEETVYVPQRKKYLIHSTVDVKLRSHTMDYAALTLIQSGKNVIVSEKEPVSQDFYLSIFLAKPTKLSLR